MMSTPLWNLKRISQSLEGTSQTGTLMHNKWKGKKIAGKSGVPQGFDNQQSFENAYHHHKNTGVDRYHRLSISLYLCVTAT